jgi:hypothetical protein
MCNRTSLLVLALIGVLLPHQVAALGLGLDEKLVSGVKDYSTAPLIMIRTCKNPLGCGGNTARPQEAASQIERIMQNEGTAHWVGPAADFTTKIDNGNTPHYAKTPERRIEEATPFLQKKGYTVERWEGANVLGGGGDLYHIMAPANNRM